MDVVPESTIILLKGVPLDVAYDHTIYFNSENYQARRNQQAFFGDLTQAGNFERIVLEKQMYQRVSSGILRIKVRPDTAYEYNYLMFINNGSNGGYAAKWFYAFITDTRYLNDVTTEIHYQIDVLQTFLPGLDYTLNACTVEREHTIDDPLFKYTLPEPIEIGDTMDRIDMTISHVSDWDTEIMVGSTFTEDYDYWWGSLYNGIFSGLAIQYFRTDVDVKDKESIYHFLDYAVNPANGDKTAGIIAMYMVPAYYAEMLKNRNQEDAISQIQYDMYAFDLRNMVLNFLNEDLGVGYYNRKLGCYPYCQIVIRQNNGNELVLKPELFRTRDNKWENEHMPGVVTLHTAFNGAIPPQIEVFPHLYDGVEYNRMYRLIYNDFPPISWNTDTFKAWLANNVGDLVIESFHDIGNFLRGMGSVFTGGFTPGIGNNMPWATAGLPVPYMPSPLSGLAHSAIPAAEVVGNTVHSFAKRIDSIRLAMNMPNAYHGTDSATIDTGTRYAGWRLIFRTIKPEIAKVVDSYFSRYGYVCGIIKIPQLANRQHFTYVKTAGCSITPKNFNAQIAQEICDIFDNGITWWKYIAPVGSMTSLDLMKVGDYSVSNSPLDDTVELFAETASLQDEDGNYIFANNSYHTIDGDGIV